MNVFIKLLQLLSLRPKQAQRPLAVEVAQPPQRHPDLPPPLQHPELGTLTYDADRGAYLGSALWCGQPIELTLDVTAPEQADAAINNALRLLSEQATWAPRIAQYAVSQLLQRKNQGWLEEDEEPLSAQAFVARMRLETIDVDASGNFCFWHNDGDLFWGHYIEISGNFSEELTHAAIPG